MKRNNFALRLLPSPHKSSQRVAERENWSMNQLINLALAEKIAVLDADYWRNRKRNAVRNPPSEKRKNLPGTRPPRRGDEVPADFRESSGKSSSPGTLKAGGLINA